MRRQLVNNQKFFTNRNTEKNLPQEVVYTDTVNMFKNKIENFEMDVIV